VKKSDVDRLLHRVAGSGSTLQEVARAEDLPALDRDAFLRERMTELFRWQQAEYTLMLQPKPRSGVAFAPSLLALLPGLVDTACSADELRLRLGARVNRSLERSWRFADAIDELGLPLADRALVDRLRSGKTVARSLEEQPALAKRMLVLAYVLLEADLLLEMLEV
jgi:hypothetical protein